MSGTIPIRRRRAGTLEHRIEQPQRSRPAGSGIRYLLIGFGSILALGWLLLVLPVASADGESIGPFDALFTAVSAICVTGLVVVDTQAQWSFFGEFVILVLIQVGGLGYMAGSAFALWLFGRRLGLRSRHMLRQYYGAPSPGETFSFVRAIVGYTVVIETAGAFVLWAALVISGEPARRSVWWSIFHSLSAFNNAGFSITGQDLLPYSENPAILLTVATLVIFGGLGALPVLDLLRRRSFHRLDLDYKLIFVTTAILLVLGTAVIAATEWTNDATIGGVPLAHRAVLAFFQSTMPRTAGFSAVNIGDMHDETLFVQIGLMTIGGAAGSTAGGIKVGTVALIGIVLVSMLRGRPDATAFGRIIPDLVIFRALALSFIFVVTVFILALVLAALNTIPFVELLFEVASATGTVGLSTGITPQLDIPSQALLIVGMLAGRFGPLLLILYMTRPHRAIRYRLPEEGIRIG